MSSGVETSCVAPSKALQRDSSTSLGMTIFAALTICRDGAFHSAAMNMAIDEALLEHVAVPVIRFYRWQSPALSFGYFGRFADVAGYQRERDLVRRWTGGGIVFHGTDLTYSILIPASDTVFAESSASIYQRIHRALVNALAETGQRGVVAGIDDPGSCNAAAVLTKFGISDPGYNCFAKPVRADVMMDGRKVAGAAQRRTRGGLLHQGSIQGVDVGNRLTERFARALSATCYERETGDHVVKRARELVQQKYGTETWLRKR